MNMPSMKASDLRIGNLVDLGNRIAKVTEINHLACVVVDLEETQDTIEDYERVKGIILTEEWLVNLGFMAYIDFGVKMGTYDKVPLCGFTYSINTNKVMIMHKGNNNSHWLDIEIKYVHQLQNLYFALTGEELILNI
jgi:hypothetical protein